MSENKEKIVESHSPKKSGRKQSILANTSIALDFCHPIVANSSLGIASMPKDDEEQSVKKIKKEQYLRYTSSQHSHEPMTVNWIHRLQPRLILIIISNPKFAKSG